MDITISDEATVHIIGLAGRYPEAEALADFWNNLKAGVDATGPVPASRWDLGRQSLGPNGEGGYGAFLTDIDQFDPLVFGIAPKDARLMDPQARLFLETSLHALESAGYAGRVGAREVGVFAAAMWSQYQLAGSGVSEGPVPNSSQAEIANRVSHCFGLTGPSLTVDTMCSSSLTALHLAVAALRNGDCEMAVAGGEFDGKIRDQKCDRQADEGKGQEQELSHCRAIPEFLVIDDSGLDPHLARLEQAASIAAVRHHQHRACGVVAGHGLGQADHIRSAA